MPSARVLLSGITALGRHGANPGERDDAQEFVVDLDVSLEVGSDSLDRTVDYRVLADVARDIVAESSFTLLQLPATLTDLIRGIVILAAAAIFVSRNRR